MQRYRQEEIAFKSRKWDLGVAGNSKRNRRALYKSPATQWFPEEPGVCSLTLELGKEARDKKTNKGKEGQLLSEQN